MSDNEIVVQEPVLVRVVQEAPEQTKAATWGGWTSFAVAARPVQILRLDTRRHRAVIRIASPNDADPGGVFLGSQAQINSGGSGPSFGGHFSVASLTTATITVESASEIWAVYDGVGPVVITVLDELYRE